MGQGPQGPEGPRGPQGKVGETKWSALNTTSKKELISLLKETYGTELKGDPGKDGTVNWDTLTVAQKEGVIKLLKDKYGDELKASIGSTDLAKLTSNLVNSTSFKKNLSESIITNTEDIVESVSEEIANNETLKDEFIRTLSSEEAFLSTLGDFLTTNETYKDRLRGPEGKAISDASLRTQLMPRTMWCADGEFCSVPVLSAGANKSFGINLIHKDALPRDLSGAQEIIGGQLGYSLNSQSITAGNAMHIEGVGTTIGNRKVYLWDNMETRDATIGNLRAGGLMSYGGGANVPLGGYVQLGEQVVKLEGMNVADQRVYLSNLPEKKVSTEGGVIYDNTWMRLLSDIEDPLSYRKGWAAEKFYARNDITAGNNVVVVGDINANRNINVKDKGFINFGSGVVGKEVDAGKIGYSTFTPGSLDIIGAGTTVGNRNITMWEDVNVKNKLSVDSVNVVGNTTVGNNMIIRGNTTVGSNMIIGGNLVIGMNTTRGNSMTTGSNMIVDDKIYANGRDILAELDVLRDKTQNFNTNGSANSTFYIAGDGSEANKRHQFNGTNLSTMWNRTQNLHTNGNAVIDFSIQGKGNYKFNGYSLSDLWDTALRRNVNYRLQTKDNYCVDWGGAGWNVWKTSCKDDQSQYYRFTNNYGQPNLTENTSGLNP